MSENDPRRERDKQSNPDGKMSFEPIVGSQGTDVIGGKSTEFEIETPLAADGDKSYSQGQLVLRRFFHHKGALAAMIVLGFIIVMAFSSIGIGPIPGWWGQDYRLAQPLVNGGHPTLTLWPFSIGEHPFGQDTVGKDYFALVMSGTQKSIIIAVGVGLISTVIGTVVGALAGYYRGWVESALMRLTDLLIVIPLLVLAAVLGKIASGWGFWGLTLMLGVVTWTSLARLVRGEVLSLRERDFVLAARAVGTSPSRIITRHILPNSVGVIIVSATLLIASAILLETSLSFLGFGVQAPDTSLGLLISQYQNAFSTRPWLFWWPGMLILTIALSVNFIGDGLRDAFDPRQNRSKD
ncbi:peptide/nickel transport system permease protein [Sediminihabitans luteus]|uniref:Peptide/nickel transport system permease protein n=1 Tax=Sediminihabitans luteus TaxID=1138585 RepID=A0A2M9CYN6_9CELL|nr:ABC transporter permease [Sediminihabitans luteus]PJJ77020.1 peptide/nickel transport system permease protein [Sediminihabitans luteus]GII99662.1 ABC transporter permease [Sediminihabitans luteus]